MNASTDLPASKPNLAGRAAWICLAIAWLMFLVPIPGLGMFIGWPLNLVAFILAIVAMSNNGALAGLWQLLSSLILSPIVFFIGLAVFAGAVGALGAASEASKTEIQTEIEALENDQAEAGTAPSSERVPEQVVSVDAGALQRAYAADEDAADRSYKGKTLSVSGEIAEISQEGAQAPVVSIRSGGSGVVRASGLSGADLQGLAKGRQIELECVGAGWADGAPLLEECAL